MSDMVVVDETLLVRAQELADMMTRKHVKEIETPQLRIVMHDTAFLIAIEVPQPKVDTGPDIDQYNSKEERQKQHEEYERVLFYGEAR